ncbi:DUF932 domain-containing protein [Desulfosarcina cetonica]|uniref:DUF932 domain-containing protein n=1 Tax=Desulfosarcina cetonica TaxID=90730 RepID=UPI0006D27980|nr:DUF932 domain-containing protein [Desulfosarcina cetonica]
MAHELYKKSIAFMGKTPWHGIGVKKEVGQSIESWIKDAGLDFEIKSAPVQFSFTGELDVDMRTMDGKYVLYRSDDGNALSVVSERYNVVQPAEVMDFFVEFVNAGNMELETAGVLGSGGKIWALAKIQEGFDLSGGDKVEPYVLLATSCDKTMATTGFLTSVRVVCQNTLNMSIGANRNQIKVPHSRQFDPDKVKKEMGLVRESIEDHAVHLKTIKGVSLDDKQAVRFFAELLKDPKIDFNTPTKDKSKERSFQKIWNSYKTAPGAENTVWGAVNAVTHSIDFNTGARSANTRLNSAWFGAGARLKQTAYKLSADESFLDEILSTTKDDKAFRPDNIRNEHSLLDDVLSVTA